MADRRYILDKLIKDNGHTHYAELGVFKGITLFYLLEQNENLSAIAVDEWLNRPDYDDVANEEDLQELKVHIYAKSYQYSDRLTLINQSTDRASGIVADSSLDLVFIDADHSYTAVRKDIAFWIDKVRLGGLLCGHDIDIKEVRQAVDDSLLKYTVEGNVWICQR